MPRPYGLVPRLNHAGTCLAAIQRETGKLFDYHNGERDYERGSSQACFAVEGDRDFAPLSQGAAAFSHDAGMEKTLDFSELTCVFYIIGTPARVAMARVLDVASGMRSGLRCSMRP